MGSAIQVSPGPRSNQNPSEQFEQQIIKERLPLTKGTDFCGDGSGRIDFLNWG